MKQRSARRSTCQRDVVFLLPPEPGEEERRESTSEAEWKWAHCGHNTNGSFIIKVLFSGKI